MKWHTLLYFGESAAKQRVKIVHDLEHKKVNFGVFVIILSVNGKDLFDIIPGYMLQKDIYRDAPIIGVAVTKEEAYEVCEKMILDVYARTGGYDVRSYFQ